MVERLARATRVGWRPWALGAALSMGCAALMVVWRWRSRSAPDAYQEWWRRRDEVRANGDQASPERPRRGSPQLFI
jgi:hypothetical protein